MTYSKYPNNYLHIDSLDTRAMHIRALILAIMVLIIGAVISYLVNLMNPPRRVPRQRYIMLGIVVLSVISGLVAWPVTSGKKTGRTVPSAAPIASPSSDPVEPIPSGSAGSPDSVDSSSVPPPPSGPVSLTQLKAEQDNIETDPTSLAGKNYVDVVRQDLFVCNKRESDFVLSKRYTRFTATAGLNDKYDTPELPWVFAVYAVGANGNTQLFKKVMKYGQAAKVDVSVSGQIRLRLSIEWINTGGLPTCAPYNEFNAVWADPKLYQ